MALDQFRIDWFREMNGALNDKLDDAALETRIADNVARMRWLAGEILARARSAHPDIDTHSLPDLLAGTELPPAQLSSQWYAEAA